MTQGPRIYEGHSLAPVKWVAIGVLAGAGTVGALWAGLASRGTTTPAPVAEPSSAVAPRPAASSEPTPNRPVASGAPRPIVTSIVPPSPAIPAQGDSRSSSPAPSAAPAAAATDQSQAVVNINTATAAELEGLPGIGPKLAQAIIDDRTRRGPFRTAADLDRVPGIGARTVERLRDRVRFE